MTNSMPISSERSCSWIPSGKRSLGIGCLFFAASRLPSTENRKFVLTAFGVISLLFGMYRYERALTDRVEAVEDLSLRASSIQMESGLVHRQQNQEISELRQDLSDRQDSIERMESAISKLEQKIADLQTRATRQETDHQSQLDEMRKEIQDLRRRLSPEEIERDSSSSHSSSRAESTPRSFPTLTRGTPRCLSRPDLTTAGQDVRGEYQLTPVRVPEPVPVLTPPRK